jgi:hypothetical protein
MTLIIKETRRITWKRCSFKIQKRGKNSKRNTSNFRKYLKLKTFMKKVFRDKIVNIENTDLFDNRFLFDYLSPSFENTDIEVIFISDLLEFKKNEEILKKVNEKPAMYSNVYSPEDELEIFKNLFDDAIKNNKKIHIV